MLTQLRTENFKAWQDTGEARLAPLTVVFGTNSSGMSSLGHLLLALKQTVLCPQDIKKFYKRKFPKKPEPQLRH